ncbi:MAG: hypothetical protein AAF851_10605 [Myxococcota bacterium]
MMDDIGTTFSKSFDGKRGNINDAEDIGCANTATPPCDSSAVGFIRTVDPNNNFDLTNNIEIDTTDIPVDWMRYETQITIDAGLVGQLLQFGFQAEASNDEPSGNFQDNVVFCPVN